MKAMVLAAGLGERMRPLTATTPKPLLPVAGKPLLEHHFDAIKRAGIHDVVINVSWLADQIVAFCGDGQQWGLNIEISHEPEPLETAGGIINALPLLGDKPFLLINGDIHTDHPLQWLRAVVLDPGAAFVVLVHNPDHHPEGDFGFDGFSVTPKVDGSQAYTYSGIGVYQASFFEGAQPGKQPLKPWLDKAIAAGRLMGEVWDESWCDVGTPERLDALNLRVAAGE